MTEKTCLPRSDIARIVMNFVRHTFNHEGGNVCRKKHFNIVTNNYGLLCIVRTFVFPNKSLINNNICCYYMFNEYRRVTPNEVER